MPDYGYGGQNLNNFFSGMLGSVADGVLKKRQQDFEQSQKTAEMELRLLQGYFHDPRTNPDDYDNIGKKIEEVIGQFAPGAAGQKARGKAAQDRAAGNGPISSLLRDAKQRAAEARAAGPAPEEANRAAVQRISGIEGTAERPSIEGLPMPGPQPPGGGAPQTVSQSIAVPANLPASLPMVPELPAERQAVAQAQRSREGLMLSPEYFRAQKRADAIDAARMKYDEELRLIEARAKATGENRPEPRQTPHTITTANGVMQYNEKSGLYDIKVGDAPERATTAPRTITTAKGIMQWNPESKAYDIKVGDRPPTGGGGSGAAPGATASDPKDIAESIIRGEQPPVMTGLYRNAAAVKAHLARSRYPLTRAETDWKAVQRHMSTLNGPQQERLRQAITFTYDSLDVIEDLFNEWKTVGSNSGFKVLNKASLAVAKNLPGRISAVATNLEAQINDLTAELGTVYKGGNASTDESLRIAAQNLKADWNEDAFKKALSQIRLNLQIRKNSILNSAPVGITPNSPYDTQPRGAGEPALPEAAAAQLQEGKQTTFGNGQVWTKRNGTPVRVR